MPQLPPIRTEFMFATKFAVVKPKILERTPFGTRIIAGVSGGSFEGTKLRGTVGPTGGEWILVRNDGAWQMDVRLTMVTDDDHLIYMTYRGVRHGPAEIIAARRSIRRRITSATRRYSRPARRNMAG